MCGCAALRKREGAWALGMSKKAPLSSVAVLKVHRAIQTTTLGHRKTASYLPYFHPA